MENDPITYKKTLGEKIKELYEKYILKPPMKNIYWINPYEIDGHYRDHSKEKLYDVSTYEGLTELGNAMLNFGYSVNDIRNALAQFSNAVKK